VIALSKSRCVEKRDRQPLRVLEDAVPPHVRHRFRGEVG
jgi:hypothetical protein